MTSKSGNRNAQLEPLCVATRGRRGKRHAGWLVVCVVMAAGASLGGPGAQAAAGEISPASNRFPRARKRPVYAGDARMAMKVELSPATTSIGSVLKALSKKTGVPLAVEPELRFFRVGLAIPEQSLRHVLDQLALVVSAKWYRIKHKYVLARNERMARIGALDEKEARLRSGTAILGLIRSLSADQKERLRAGFELGYGDLSRSQRRWAGRIATGFYANPVKAGPFWLTQGRTVTMRMRRSGQQWEISIMIEGPQGLLGGASVPSRPGLGF